MNKIDSIIQDIRTAISAVAEDLDSETVDLVNFLGLKDEAAYHSVMDSFYLLEDTQLAKREFLNIDFLEESLGKLYLMFYGVLNSCYMQQQAVLVISEKLRIEQNIEEIRNIEVVTYRNDFSAHSANRGKGKSEHSYILDRLAMREAKVKGYTANSKTGFIFKEANINSLISDWDVMLEKQLTLISKRTPKKQ
ncbi:hypothetical protein [Agarivorans gilvus]|uniref:Uncharacterized protein n=1 Tax=Agarivorans gilvus TaxID=680279 RepID=A0ABQ1I7I0_9ALTE|nr:hypothetical protein [Agarivorans gilvus]GGB20014.1 hypothetical protein GCM10007414_36780 [Agarivorans gilvus]